MDEVVSWSGPTEGGRRQPLLASTGVREVLCPNPVRQLHAAAHPGVPCGGRPGRIVSFFLFHFFCFFFLKLNLFFWTLFQKFEFFQNMNKIQIGKKIKLEHILNRNKFHIRKNSNRNKFQIRTNFK
jgi:hypothetical protein